MYLGPKVKDDLRSEEGRRLSHLTKFRIIEEKLKVSVSIGGGQIQRSAGRLIYEQCQNQLFLLYDGWTST
jgi:hypothetical protein